MPSIFISYRREDTSGEAARLANDLAGRFGRANVFIDIDTIAPGADFVERIRESLDACNVTLVLLGHRWLTAAAPDGTRRIDHESDYVRMEIAAALVRTDTPVIPILIDGARMPPAEELPPDIASLPTRNGFELSNRRWRRDLSELVAVVQSYDDWWWRALRMLRRKAWPVAPIAALLIGGALAAVLALGGGASGKRPSPGLSCTATFRLQNIPRYEARMTFSGLSCAEATDTVNAYEHIPHPYGPPDLFSVGRLPNGGNNYDSLSAPFIIPILNGDLSCRAGPRGLGGSEHTVRCVGSDPNHKHTVLNWNVSQAF